MSCVLVVDDHASLREMTLRLLDLLGERWLEAEDEAAAEAIFREHAAEVDVALLDLHLGGGSGTALARRLQVLKPELRVLFMSGYGREDLEMPDLAAPRRQFLEKPFSVGTLGAALAALRALP